MNDKLSPVDSRRGRIIASTHQATPLILSNSFPLCDPCALKDRCPDYSAGQEGCPFFTRILESRIRKYSAVPHIEETDVELVVMYSKALTTVDLISAYASAVGPFTKQSTKEGLDVLPILNYKTKIEKQALDLAKELGLTPAVRRRLELEQRKRGEEFDVDALLNARASAHDDMNIQTNRTSDLSESFISFCDAFHISLYQWNRDVGAEAFARIDGHFRYSIAVASLPRGNGKSRFAGTCALWMHVTGPSDQTLSVSALNREGTAHILTHIKKILRDCPDLAKIVKVHVDEIRLPGKHSKIVVTSREHTSGFVRGPHSRLIIYDEAGHTDSLELFAALLSGQASVPDPLALVVSTVGYKKAGPLWMLKERADAGDPNIYFFHTTENLSPDVSPTFLRKQKGILSTADYEREHENTWQDQSSNFVLTDDVDACMGFDWRGQHIGKPDKNYFVAVDLGRVGDPSVVTVGHTEENVIFVDKIEVLKGDRKNPVPLVAVEAIIGELCDRFRVALVKVESWQGALLAERLSTFAKVATQIVEPSLKLQMQEWPLLAQRISDRSLIIPHHPQLRNELLGLTWEATAQGMKVVDKGRAHQDIAVTLRMIVAIVDGGKQINPDLPGPAVFGQREMMRLYPASAPPMRDPRPNAYGEGDDYLSPWASGGGIAGQIFDW